ncbi:caspase-3-like [Xenia sp. Carnegie-2017]|uniref:caspase-3-like n=1 Tax=Xenia sp. Carnegie-2017 TaxID=2897299 RepID=UPI001F0428E4|nr:caspase-3-like [Xenia sp. Carnegie-2017]
MSEVLLYRLRMNREVVLIDLEAPNVLDYLYQEDVLDFDNYEEVRDTKPRKKQAELLLEFVEKGGHAAITKFIYALEHSSQRHLARILLTKIPNEDELCRGIHNEIDEKEATYYPMNRRPCGYAVIINICEFDKVTKLETREGSNIDVQRMKSLFEWLRFKVEIYINQTADEIMQIIRYYRLDFDHRNFDCFSLFLMSHGFNTRNGDGIFSRDGKHVYLKNIRENFTSAKCHSLSNKPKLFFVQACRGNAPDEPYVVTDAPSHQTSMIAPIPALDSHSYASTTSTRFDNDPVPPNRARTLLDHPGTSTTNTSLTTSVDNKLGYTGQCIPLDADFFVAHASTENFAAMRNTLTGGWFVSQLDRVIREYATKEDLQDMLTRVIRNVATRQSDEGVQCPQFSSNLRKKVKFNPVII